MESSTIMSYDDLNKSWEIHLYADGWYYHNADGDARGPFDTEDLASNSLDDYEHGYYSCMEYR